jgi:hypothetical protein
MQTNNTHLPLSLEAQVKAHLLVFYHINLSSLKSVHILVHTHQFGLTGTFQKQKREKS